MNHLIMSQESSTTSSWLKNQQPHHVSRITNNLIMFPESKTTSSCLKNQQPHHVSRIKNNHLIKLKRNYTLTKREWKQVYDFTWSPALSSWGSEWQRLTTPGYSSSDTRETNKSVDNEADRFRQSAIQTGHSSNLFPERLLRETVICTEV